LRAVGQRLSETLHLEPCTNPHLRAVLECFDLKRLTAQVGTTLLEILDEPGPCRNSIAGIQKVEGLGSNLQIYSLSPGGLMRERLADRLEKLLRLVPDEEREYQMSECERMADEAGMLASAPRTDSPSAFAQDLLVDNPNIFPLIEIALNRDLNPEGMWETPDELIASLMPSDGHLD
jgi:hypothetical protein